MIIQSFDCGPILPLSRGDYHVERVLLGPNLWFCSPPDHSASNNFRPQHYRRVIVLKVSLHRWHPPPEWSDVPK